MTETLFHEIYSSYYRAAAKLIEAAQSGNLEEAEAAELIRKTAFSESFIYILEAIKSGQWQFLTPELRTPLRAAPKRPMTRLERRWLQAIRLDPRMALFQEPSEDGKQPDTEGGRKLGMEGGRKLDSAEAGLEPLYRPEDFHITDQAGDGDPYGDYTYRTVFRTILKAVKDKTELKVAYISGKGKARWSRCMPYRLEYSEKDDKFRLLARGQKGLIILNLARIKECRVCESDDTLGWVEAAGRTGAASQAETAGRVETAGQAETAGPAEAHGRRRLRNRRQKGRLSFNKRKAVLLLTDERNALERCLLHFADLEKITTQLSDLQYRLELYYRREDETEIVIRCLSFGPFLQAISPPEFTGLILSRLKKQQYLMNRSEAVKNEQHVQAEITSRGAMTKFSLK